MTPKQFNTEQEFKAWNEEMAQKYDPDAYHERSFFLIRMLERLRVEIILDFIASSSELHVLEVGCGAGNVLERVNSDHRVGVDISAYLLGKAKSRLKDNALLLMANAEKLPFAPAQFDRLICTEVLEHVQNPAVVLADMARIAAEDSIIVVSVPNEKMIDAVKSMAMKLNLAMLFSAKKGSYAVPEKMTDEWHLHRFDLDLLRKYLPANMVIASVRAVPFALLPLRYVAKIKLGG